MVRVGQSSRPGVPTGSGTESIDPPFSRFYDVTEHFAKRFDAVGRQWAFRGGSPRAAKAWQKKLSAKLHELLGLNTFEPTPPRLRLRGREDQGAYWREDWTMHTEPDVIATFYVFVPKNIRPGEQRPAVVCAHGHISAGRFAPAGRRDVAPVAKTIAVHNYDYAVQLVKRGLITVAMDARGFGQRRIQHRQDSGQLLHGSCHELMLMGQGLGQTVTGMWVWDLLRLVDYLVTRPEVDSARIGCAGLSGGGLQTLYLAAVDSRIQAAVVSGYYYGVKDALIRQADNCACNSIPNLWKFVDLGDVGGLIAPRGLFIETGDNDPLNGPSLKNVTTQVGYTRKVYRSLGCAGQLVHHIFPGEHRWCGEQSVPWLAQQLDLKSSRLA